MLLKRKRSSDFDISAFDSYGGFSGGAGANGRVVKRLRDSKQSPSSCDDDDYSHAMNGMFYYPQPSAPSAPSPSSHDASMSLDHAPPSPPTSDSSSDEIGMAVDIDMDMTTSTHPTTATSHTSTSTPTAPSSCISCGDHVCPDCSAAAVIGSCHSDSGRCVLCAESESLQTIMDVAHRIGGGAGWTGFTKGRQVYWRLDLAGKNPCLGAMWSHGREAW